MSSPDAVSPPTPLPAFDDCADAMLDSGVLMSPAELHGALCGLLGGGAVEDPDRILRDLEAALAIDLSGSAAACCRDMQQATSALFAEDPWRFQPLLPDDDMDLTQRVESLGAWCRGFLGGYAQARVSAGGADRPVAEDSAEALRDFAAIAQAGMDEDSTGAPPEVADGADAEEEAERHYTEVVEYLRAATLTIMADTKAEPGGTLH